MSEPIVLQELIEPDLTPGRRVKLVDHSMAEEGFEEARELKLERTVYPGGDQVDTQVLGLMDEDLELAGQLRDQWSSPGFAAAARSQLRALQASKNPVFLSWGETFGRLGYLQRIAFEHVRGGLRYRLVFRHAELAEANAEILPTLNDPGAAMRAVDKVSEQVDVLAAIEAPLSLVDQVARDVFAAVSSLRASLAPVRTMMEGIASAAQLSEVALASVQTDLSRGIALAVGLRTKLGSVALSETAVPADGMGVLQAMLYQARILGALLRLENSARHSVTLLMDDTSQDTRDVIVREGDTWQQIALRTLGDTRRWYELQRLNGVLPGAAPVGIVRVPR